MSKALYLLVVDAKEVIDSLPDVGLSGERVSDHSRGQVVKVASTENDDLEDMWFALSWYADRLGIMDGRVAEEDSWT